MKSLIDKFFADITRFEFLFLFVPFILWVFCFRHFFTGHLHLEADAISYADHINFYTDNLSKGVFPLWDPRWYNGAPNDFFLRRIGDVNPLYFIIMLLKWIGCSSANAYLVFLGIYYFLAGWAFYLITRFLLADRFFAFTAYTLFLFSSWGSQIFYNYIIIIFVPIIWFFYFLLCFQRNPQKGCFLGMCLCAGLVVTTYIPFFFLTILTIFSFFYIIFYWKNFFIFLSHSFAFLRKNKIFTVFCIIFLLSSCVPGLIFYKESKSGDFVLPNRHLGAGASSEVAVSFNNVASGDIISHGFFDRIFDDHENMDLGDIYMPYIFYLILLTTVLAQVNRLIFFLLFNILAFSLITITSVAGVHRFLYEHIIFFKFIRQIYYFFWLVMLPMGILLSVAAFKSLQNNISTSSKRLFWLIYIIFCHLIFVLFLTGHQRVLWGAWAAVFISLFYFLIYFRYRNNVSLLAGFCLILLAVFVQSVQVYNCLERKLFQSYIMEDAYVKRMPLNPKRIKLDLYYASNWFAILVNYIDPQVLDDYKNHQFIFYDNVIPYKDSQEFFKILQSAFSANTNIAFLSSYESGPGDWSNSPDAGPQADINPIGSGKLAILGSDANTWRLKTNLLKRQFLVINDNFNRDWHAFINGHQARLLRANGSFKGLWIPQGESTVVLRFSTPGRYLLHFSLLVLFNGVFLYLLVLLRIKKKKDPVSYV
ncbi:MAG: hypothetical protein HQL12_08515 [Candidatus Omnitrophica bacterium]|nr:hypothetical protein [Candidatus Omnitrophota bacterium]